MTFDHPEIICVTFYHPEIISLTFDHPEIIYVTFNHPEIICATFNNPEIMSVIFVRENRIVTTNCFLLVAQLENLCTEHWQFVMIIYISTSKERRNIA